MQASCVRLQITKAGSLHETRAPYGRARSDANASFCHADGKQLTRGAQSLGALFGRSVSSVAVWSCRGRSTPATPASLPGLLYVPLGLPLPLPPSLPAPADTFLPTFPLRSRARPSFVTPCSLKVAGQSGCGLQAAIISRLPLTPPVARSRACRGEINSRPHPLTPFTYCVSYPHGVARPDATQVVRAVRTALLARSAWRLACALQRAMLPTVAARFVERIPRAWLAQSLRSCRVWTAR